MLSTEIVSKRQMIYTLWRETRVIERGRFSLSQSAQLTLSQDVGSEVTSDSASYLKMAAWSEGGHLPVSIPWASGSHWRLGWRENKFVEKNKWETWHIASVVMWSLKATCSPLRLFRVPQTRHTKYFPPGAGGNMAFSSKPLGTVLNLVNRSQRAPPCSV